MKKLVLSALLVLMGSNCWAGPMQEAAELLLESAGFNGAKISFRTLGRDGSELLTLVGKEDARKLSDYMYLGTNPDGDAFYLRGIPAHRGAPVQAEEGGPIFIDQVKAKIDIQVIHRVKPEDGIGFGGGATPYAWSIRLGRSVSEKINKVYAEAGMRAEGVSGSASPEYLWGSTNQGIIGMRTEINTLNVENLDVALLERLLEEIVK